MINANDSADVWNKKIDIINKFLDSKEANVFTADRSSLGNTNSGILKSPDGKSQVNLSDLTPAQIKEAQGAGWQ